MTRAIEAFAALVAETESPVDVPEPDSSLVDFELAARVDFAPDAKQELLASTSPRERLERLTELLLIALEAIRPGEDPARARRLERQSHPTRERRQTKAATTKPAPPRRASPAAASSARTGSISTALVPPK